MSSSFIKGLLSGSILSGTSLLYATLGEVIVQRSGIVNLGLEGVLLIGASVAFAVTAETGSPALGVLAAGLAGGLFNLIFGYLSPSTLKMSTTAVRFWLVTFRIWTTPMAAWRSVRLYLYPGSRMS